MRASLSHLEHYLSQTGGRRRITVVQKYDHFTSLVRASVLMLEYLISP